MEFPYTTTVIWATRLSGGSPEIEAEIEVRKSANQTDGELLLSPGGSIRRWATLADAESWRDFCNSLNPAPITFLINGPDTPAS